MGIYGGSNIITNGLIFGYDADDRSSRYYKGEPTTNLAANGILNGMDIALTYIGIENGWKKYSLNGTWTRGTYPFIMNITSCSFIGGAVYTSSCYIKTNVKNKFVTFGDGGISYVNQPMINGGIGKKINLDNNIVYIERAGFAYSGTTTQPGYIPSMPVSGVTFDPQNDFIYIKNIQVEQKNHPTQFINGVRSATNSLIDLTGQNVINLANMNFDSTAHPYFDGLSNYIEISKNDGFGTVNLPPNITLNMWMKLERKNGEFYQHIAGFRNNSNFDFYFLLLDANGSTVNTEARIRTTGGLYDINVPFVLYFNTWVNVVFVGDINQARLYINGELVGSIEINGVFGSIAPDFYIGLEYHPKGYIPNITLYNRALTINEIKQNYNTLKSRFIN